jgi:1-acyl-sn-glycerol-3-phosphate acyltransferase
MGIARALLRLAGWKVHFAGLPARQGVIIVYPHTSNWDFVVGILAKWAIGLKLEFWAKDSLFRVPVFGAWLRSLGGVPVDRSGPKGLTQQSIEMFKAKKAADEYFWVALAPEGTRKHTPGFKSGFYRTALGADVPLGIATLDYGRREVRVMDFIRLSGEQDGDMARIAAVLQGVKGCKPANAAPLRIIAK